MSDRGILFVLSAPSGAGKDTVLAHLLARDPSVKKCVTATTRAPRPGEVDGRDYHFWSEEEFARHDRVGDLIESAVVHGHRYGTPRRWVEEQLARGSDVFLVIDVQGGVAVKKLCPEAVMIFLMPPSLGVLEERLRGRSSDSEAQIRRRLRDASYELAQRDRYDYTIVNDVLEDAVAKLAAIVLAERCRAWRSVPADREGRPPHAVEGSVA